MSNNSFSLIYQTGGTANFKWNRVLGAFSRTEADAKRDEIMRMGYPTMIYKTSELDAIGGPSAFAEIRNGAVVFAD